MAPADAPLHIEVAYSPRAGEVDRVALELPAGATVADALQRSGLLGQHGLALVGLHVGIWGRIAALDDVLQPRDRVEVYRPLKVDPKEARRLRYRRDGPRRKTVPGRSPKRAT
jgi:putative ubiquitin-RnfH superfamily antitoxin RatB of RatAB toxin-antitoxin module